LQISELERRKYSVFTEKTSMQLVIEEVRQILQQKINKKAIRFSVEAKKEVTMYANKDQLKQVLMNLITNAIIYTPHYGEVTVEVTKNENDILLKVSDNGIGIPYKDQERIFERFYRVDKGRSR